MSIKEIDLIKFNTLDKEGRFVEYTDVIKDSLSYSLDELKKKDSVGVLCILQRTVGFKSDVDEYLSVGKLIDYRFVEENDIILLKASLDLSEAAEKQLEDSHFDFTKLSRADLRTIGGRVYIRHVAIRRIDISLVNTTDLMEAVVTKLNNKIIIQEIIVTFYKQWSLDLGIKISRGDPLKTIGKLKVSEYIPSFNKIKDLIDFSEYLLREHPFHECKIEFIEILYSRKGFILNING